MLCHQIGRFLLRRCDVTNETTNDQDDKSNAGCSSLFEGRGRKNKTFED